MRVRLPYKCGAKYIRKQILGIVNEDETNHIQVSNLQRPPFADKVNFNASMDKWLHTLYMYMYIYIHVYIFFTLTDLHEYLYKTQAMF